MTALNDIYRVVPETKIIEKTVRQRVIRWQHVKVSLPILSIRLPSKATYTVLLSQMSQIIIVV